MTTVSIDGQRAPANRVEDDVLLDAARDCVLAVGFRRTTLTDVARRAGVSRMTVYRRFPDVRSLVAALMTREFSGLLHQAAAEAEDRATSRPAGRNAAVPSSEGAAPAVARRDGEHRAAVRPRAGSAGNVRERLVAATIATVRRLTENPLLRTVLELDPELLVPYLVERIGGTQRLAEEFLRERVIAGHRDGSVRHADPDVQARMLFLTVQSVVLSLRPAASGLSVAALLAELGHQLDAALRPPAEALQPTEAATNTADALPPAEAATNTADARLAPEAAENAADSPASAQAATGTPDIHGETR